MQDAAISNTTNQDLSQSLKQVAKASVSGINFGAFSKAENIGSQIQSAQTKISNRINMECNSGASARNIIQQTCKDIQIEGGGDGSATGCSISDVKQTATVKMAQDCKQKAVVNNKAVQNLQQTMDQLAVAKTVGFDLTSFLIAIVICVAVVFLLVFKGVSSFGGMIVAAAGSLMTLIGAIMWYMAISRNGGWDLKDVNGYGFVDYHSGPRGDGTNTYATAGLAFDDGFGHGGPSDSGKDANTPPTCKEKSLEQEFLDEECPKQKDRMSCGSLEYGKNGFSASQQEEGATGRACHWDRNRCKPKWITEGNNFGWCYKKAKGTSAAAYEACSSSEQCTSWFWKKDGAYDPFERRRAFDDAFPNGGPFADPDCNDKRCCDWSKCLKTGNYDSGPCKGCCPSGLMAGGHPYTLELKRRRGRDGDHKDDYEWWCKRCNKDQAKAQGDYYLYSRHPMQTSFLPKENPESQKRIDKFLSCFPGIETWGCVEVPRARDLLGVLGAAFTVGGILTIIGGLYYQLFLAPKPQKSILESAQEVVAAKAKKTVEKINAPEAAAAPAAAAPATE